MVHFYPQGAIQTNNELNRYAGCILYAVHGLGSHSFLSEYKIHPQAVVEYDDDPSYKIATMALVGDRQMFCPGDCNVEKHHNQHYLFYNKEDADAYLAYAKQQPHRLNHSYSWAMDF